MTAFNLKIETKTKVVFGQRSNMAVWLGDSGFSKIDTQNDLDSLLGDNFNLNCNIKCESSDILSRDFPQITCDLKLLDSVTSEIKVVPKDKTTDCRIEIVS